MCELTGTNCALSSGCAPGTACSTCNTGFFYSSTQCQACHSSCLTCSAASSTSCLSCPTGFALSGMNACDSCLTGYQPTMSGGVLTCPLCSASLTGCLECTSNACTLCGSGYGLSNGGCAACSGSQSSNGLVPCHSCIRCSGTCDAATECSTCNDGYYYDSSAHQCSACL